MFKGVKLKPRLKIYKLYVSLYIILHYDDV